MFEIYRLLKQTSTGTYTDFIKRLFDTFTCRQKNPQSEIRHQNRPVLVMELAFLFERMPARNMIGLIHVIVTLSEEIQSRRRVWMWTENDESNKDLQSVEKFLTYNFWYGDDLLSAHKVCLFHVCVCSYSFVFPGFRM